MEFSVIYSFDATKDTGLLPLMPPHWRKYWKVTESNDLSDEAEIEGFPRHRKWCGYLPKKEFLEFVEKFYLEPSTWGTSGSLGAPGLGFGISPAIAFEGTYEESGSAFLTAYVTPIPSKGVMKRFSDNPKKQAEFFCRVWKCLIDAFGVTGLSWQDLWKRK